MKTEILNSMPIFQQEQEIDIGSQNPLKLFTDSRSRKRIGDEMSFLYPLPDAIVHALLDCHD